MSKSLWDNLVQLNKNKSEKVLVSTEEVLGSLEDVYAIADLWENHAGKIDLIGVAELVSYTSNEFTSDEMTAFKKGLAAIPLFMQKCWNERDKINKSL